MKKNLLLTLILVFIMNAANGCNPVNQLAISPSAEPILEGKSLIVTSIADSGSGTLRQFLLEALPGDTITFDSKVFPPDSPSSIYFSSNLPELNKGNLTIDASNAGVILDGTQVDSGHGLSISSDGNVIRGLQIVNFPDAGIGIFGGAQNNIIGGDRKIGSGPLGQGNLISGNGNFGVGLWDEGTSNNSIQGNYIGVNLDATKAWGHARDGIHSNGANGNFITGNVIGGNDTGVYLCCVTEGKNVITDNFIGTDPTGLISLGNQTAGVLIDRSNDNVIGPGNKIAYNVGPGIMFWEQSSGNTNTQNLIHDNGVQNSSSELNSAPPVILDFDLMDGSLTGVACLNCTVEIFSDNEDEGGTFEGRTMTNSSGNFTFEKGSNFIGPHLTATATDNGKNTSLFSKPTVGTQGLLNLQVEAIGAKFLFEYKPSINLDDNRIGGSFSRVGSSIPGKPYLGENYPNMLSNITDIGLKRVDITYGELEPPIDWSVPEFEIPAEYDKFIDELGLNGVSVNYMLHFWDKSGHAQGIELTTPRFTTEKQIQDYLDYVRFIVKHFRGRIRYYTIWSEPDNCLDPPLKCVHPLDYIELARRTIPIIREEDPEAKVVLAPVVLYFARDYLFTLLQSDVISQFDVISWHGMYDVTPDATFFGNYYYEYPSIIESIKQTATDNGFQGEFWGTELTWRVEGVSEVPENQPWEGHTQIQSAKYWTRAIVMELGLDLGVGLGGPSPETEYVAYQTIRNLNTIMAGVHTTSLQMEIQSNIENLMSYSFSLDDGSKLVAIWNNGVAIDDAVGIPATITFPDFSGKKVVGIDVLNGFKQELTTITDDGQLVIPNLLIMDYPILIHMEP